MNAPRKAFLSLAILAATSALSPLVTAQPNDLPAPGARVAPTDAAQVHLSFAPIVRKAAPAVVNV